MANSKTIKDVRNNLASIGDKAKKAYDSNEDLKTGLLAVKAYGEITKTLVAQVRYKQATGTPSKIDFLEE